MVMARRRSGQTHHSRGFPPRRLPRSSRGSTNVDKALPTRRRRRHARHGTMELLSRRRRERRADVSQGRRDSRSGKHQRGLVLGMLCWQQGALSRSLRPGHWRRHIINITNATKIEIWPYIMGSVLIFANICGILTISRANDYDDLSFAFLSLAQRLGGQFSSIDRVS